MKSIELTEKHKDILFHIPLFRDLPDYVKSKLLDKLEYTIYDVAIGDIIAEQGDQCRKLYVLLSGRLKIDIIDYNGCEILIEHIEAARAFATPHLFKEDNRMPATFKAMENSILFTATKESTFRLISEYPEILKSFLKITGRCTACTTMRLDILSKRTIRERLVAYFLKHNRLRLPRFTMPHSLTQLAQYLNVSRPALSTEFNKMEKEGLITRLEKNMIELNPKIYQTIL